MSAEPPAEHPPLPPRADVIAYVREHDNIHMQQLVEAAYEWLDELDVQLSSTARSGLSPDGRAVAVRLYRGSRVAMGVALAALLVLIGWGLHELSPAASAPPAPAHSTPLPP